MKVSKQFFLLCEMPLPETFYIEMEVKESLFKKIINDISFKYPVYHRTENLPLERNGKLYGQYRVEYFINDDYQTVVGYTVKTWAMYDGKSCSFKKE